MEDLDGSGSNEAVPGITCKMSPKETHKKQISVKTQKLTTNTHKMGGSYKRLNVIIELLQNTHIKHLFNSGKGAR